MKYEVAKTTNMIDEWRVEAINDEGGIAVTLFTGPMAKERAVEYAAVHAKCSK